MDCFHTARPRTGGLRSRQASSSQHGTLGTVCQPPPTPMRLHPPPAGEVPGGVMCPRWSTPGAMATYGSIFHCGLETVDILTSAGPRRNGHLGVLRLHIVLCASTCGSRARRLAGQPPVASECSRATPQHLECSSFGKVEAPPHRLCLQGAMQRSLHCGRRVLRLRLLPLRCVQTHLHAGHLREG